jgi:hypothetical protein
MCRLLEQTLLKNFVLVAPLCCETIDITRKAPHIDLTSPSDTARVTQTTGNRLKLHIIHAIF